MGIGRAERARARRTGVGIPLLIRRAGELLPNPDKRTPLQAGDIVIVFGEPGTLRPIEGQ